MTNETEQEIKKQETQKIRKVSTGAWWKSFKKKKVEKNSRANEQAQEVKAKPGAPEKTQPAEPEQIKPAPQIPEQGQPQAQTPDQADISQNSATSPSGRAACKGSTGNHTGTSRDHRSPGGKEKTLAQAPEARQETRCCATICKGRKQARSSRTGQGPRRGAKGAPGNQDEKHALEGKQGKPQQTGPCAKGKKRPKQAGKGGQH